MATRHNDPTRTTPEWPPHPDRLYSALVAAAAEPKEGAGEDAGTYIPDVARDALQWLGEQGSPQLAVSRARLRSAPEVHMPTNPHENEVWQKPKRGQPRAPQKNFDFETLLPLHRKKAALPIPAVIPDEPVAYFIWPRSDPNHHLDVLQSICERVTYLGRSRSLVQVSAAGNMPSTPRVTHVPDPLGQVQLRVPGPDRLCYLIDKYERDGGKPEPSPPHRYRTVEVDLVQAKMTHTVFDRMFIFKPQRGDPALPAESTVNVTQALRPMALEFSGWRPIDKDL